MHEHRYVRAYMAGIVLPTVFLLIAMTAFTIARYVYAIPTQIERVAVIPMAVVPNLWGLWNILYVAFVHRRMPIGAFGAILPLLLMPAGFILTRLIDFALPAFVYHAWPFALPVGVALYYLLWKHVVGTLNAVVGLP